LKNAKKGLFIVFEGIDGSGKSTQANLLYRKLTRDGYSCIVTEEPGGTHEGKKIRDLLLNPGFHISPKTELFLFLADRAQHVSSVIQPALEEAKIVICSRYFFSTLVYQGIARKTAEFDFLKAINLFAVSNIVPDVVFYLDVVPEHGLKKAKSNTAQVMGLHGGDRIEREGVDFQQGVREGYLMLARQYNNIFFVISDGKDIQEISRVAYENTIRRLKND
jgi:dTMP kinase